MDTIDFIMFNIYESTFWLALAVVSGFFMLHGVPMRYRFLGVHTTLTLLAFGLSDLIENYMGGFWYANEWLFVIKSACVLGLLTSLVWFVHLRSTGTP